MPGGSPLTLFLQKVFWAIGIFSIFFIGAFLLALQRSGHKKHPVIAGFLMTSWFTAWITLLPFFGRVWEHATPTPLNHSNVMRCFSVMRSSPERSPTHNLPNQCGSISLPLDSHPRVRREMLYSLAFVIEVMRMLLKFLRFSKIEEPESPKKPFSQSFRRKGSVESNSSGISDESFSSDNTSLSSLESLHEGSSVRSNVSISRKLKKLRKSHWRKSILLLPFVTALPSLIMVYDLQASMGWRYVHADQFICLPADPLMRRKKALIILCHLVPTSFLAIACVITYFVLRYRTATGFHRQIHYPLLIRLSAMSVLSGIGAALEFSIDFSQFSRGIAGKVPSFYLITSPLVSAVFFVDKEIIKEWKSWVRLQ
ncbi:hypothetical protein VP01_972g6 [Puccinia sorghi]|uniref:Uncharacterized protein n=1 Tax=Puccinia sorghi TaxID=27349 RepID=A0A0L6U816_9BASI|nr:hypothetical protein VP01_972g6 [Puccinia sorghi]